MKNGALDVYLTPVMMKKGRPGTLLSVMCKLEELNEFSSLIFSETGTIGFRTQFHLRKKLPRKTEVIKTNFGKAKVKIVTEGERIYISPEYEDCKILAEKHNIPLKDVYREVEKVYWRKRRK